MIDVPAVGEFEAQTEAQALAGAGGVAVRNQCDGVARAGEGIALRRAGKRGTAEQDQSEQNPDHGRRYDPLRLAVPVTQC